MVLTLVSMMFNIEGLNWNSPIDHFETFSGGGSVTMGEVEAGRTAVSFDIIHDEVKQSMLTRPGFCNALFWALNLKPGAGKVTAPVCSTWVFMPRPYLVNAQVKTQGTGGLLST